MFNWNLKKSKKKKLENGAQKAATTENFKVELSRVKELVDIRFVLIKWKEKKEKITFKIQFFLTVGLLVGFHLYLLNTKVFVFVQRITEKATAAVAAAVLRVKSKGKKNMKDKKQKKKKVIKQENLLLLWSLMFCCADYTRKCYIDTLTHMF